MDANALLPEILKRSDFIFMGWNVLMLAGLGVILLVALFPTLRVSTRGGRAVVAGFAFFAVTHLLGMMHVVKQWESLSEAFRHKLAAEPALAEKIDFAISAPHITWIVPFHLAFDAFVILAVWWLGRAKGSEVRT
jgi:hypothetical protein